MAISETPALSAAGARRQLMPGLRDLRSAPVQLEWPGLPFSSAGAHRTDAGATAGLRVGADWNYLDAAQAKRIQSLLSTP